MLIERRSSRRLMNQINVVPYIDVMLVLLVIFMVTAPLVNPGQVDLPSVGKASQPAIAPMEVSIRSANCEPPISMENTPTGKRALTATCSAILSANAVFPIDGRPARWITSGRSVGS